MLRDLHLTKTSHKINSVILEMQGKNSYQFQKSQCPYDKITKVFRNSSTLSNNFSLEFNNIETKIEQRVSSVLSYNVIRNSAGPFTILSLNVG